MRALRGKANSVNNSSYLPVPALMLVSPDLFARLGIAARTMYSKNCRTRDREETSINTHCIIFIENDTVGRCNQP